MLHLGEVFAYGDGAVEVAGGRSVKLGGDGAGHHVRHDELAWLDGGGDAADVVGLGVVGREVLDLRLEARPATVRIPRGLGHLAALVDEAVHALAPADQVLRRTRVAGDDHAAAAALEQKAHGRLHRVVVHVEGAHGDSAHLEDLALLELSNGNTGPLALHHVMAADLDVPVEVVEELLHLPLRPRRSPHLEGRVLPRDPARDQEVPQVDDVVGVVMCDEHSRPVVRAHARLHELDAHAGARVDEELLVTVAEQRGWTAALRIGRGRTGAEEDGAHNVRRVPAGARAVKALPSPSPLPLRGRGRVDLARGGNFEVGVGALYGPAV